METIEQKREATARSLAAQAPLGQDLAEREPREVVQADSASLMAVISRAAADPNTDVDKMERLIAMAERLEAKKAKAEYLAAMIAMKPELPVIDRKGRIEVREKTASGKRDGEITQSTGYARWEDIDEAITPILTKHGFVLTFRSGTAQDGKVTVTGILSHKAGHSEDTTVALPHDSSGSKNPVQAVGSSTSYGKRIAATLLLNIRTKGEDDDGTAGGADDTISDDEISTIMEMLTKDKADVAGFCRVMKVEMVADIKKRDYQTAITTINDVGIARAARAKKAAAQ